MGFQKGNRANPGGRRAEKPWREALELVLNEKTPEGLKKLRKVAEAVVKAAMDGDMQAANIIGDRLDGKPQQGVTLDGNLSMTHEDFMEAARQRRLEREKDAGHLPN
jgi:hypothetical protein